MQIFLLCSCYDPELHTVGKHDVRSTPVPFGPGLLRFPEKNKSSVGSSLYFCFKVQPYDHSLDLPVGTFSPGKYNAKRSAAAREISAANSSLGISAREVIVNCK